jgi:hypothetical protein
MPCEPILSFKIDKESQAALERIEEKTKLGKLLATTITAGVFNSIFTKNKAPVAGWNITTTDWDLYAQAVNAIPAITKRAIQQEIDFMILHYSQRGKYDHNHAKFWRGMKDGCK